MPALPIRLAVEVVGTFGFLFLGFSGIAAAVDAPGSIGPGGIAVGFGGGLALMLFAGGHISGGHYNPAVTAALAAGGQFPRGEVLAYWAAQIAGALAASLLALALYSGDASSALVNAPGDAVSDATALVIEAVATFLFVLVIMAVATDKRPPWNGVLAPLAIGGFVLVGATVIGPFTGGSFNPARSLAPAIIDGELADLWVYLVGPFVGAVAGGLAYTYLRDEVPAVPEAPAPLGPGDDAG